jgi:radical SAM protein with 4Fe4S-binding SPASM domain
VYRLQIESTLSCPQLCDYCYAESKPDSPQGMSSRKIKEVLDSAAAMDVKVIDWLGGDPLVRPDWEALCEHATALGMVNNIWTSGLPLANHAIARRAVELTNGGFLSVHVDSIDPAGYARVHGDRGIHADVGNIKRILRGVQNALDAGKDPGAMVNCITFTKDLAGEGGDAKKTIQYFHEKFGIKTCLTLYKPASRTIKGSVQDWQPTPEQMKDTYKFRDALYPNDPPVGAMDVTKFYCGWLVPCSVIRTTEFGNVHDESLEGLVNKHRQRLMFMDFRNPATMPGKCGDCASNSVCFGCRSNAFYYAGDVCAEDPMCQAYCKKG